MANRILRMNRNFSLSAVSARGPRVFLVLCIAMLLAGLASFPGIMPGGSSVFAVARHRQAPHGMKRLILQDGSYRDVVRFKVKDGHVRYQSVKDGAWQQMSASLVDWTATKQWNHAHPHGVTGESGFENLSPAQLQSDVTQIDNEEHAQRAAAQDLMPVIKPGLRLPDESGIFALDEYRGQPNLVHLQQADGDLNQYPFHSVQLVDVYRMHGFAELVRMQGVHAPVQLHLAKPVFYVSVQGQPAAAPADAFVVNANIPPDHKPGVGAGGGSEHSQFVIVKVVRQGGSRVIFAEQLRNIDRPNASGNLTLTQETLLPGGDWMKVTPRNALLPGEYALVELLAPQAVNRDVWDFGVNPEAPENQQARLPVQ